MKLRWLGLFFYLGISLLSSPSFAAVQRGWDGNIYGNICRSGLYYEAYFSFYLVGSRCYLPYWGMWGFISYE